MPTDRESYGVPRIEFVEEPEVVPPARKTRSEPLKVPEERREERLTAAKPWKPRGRKKA